LLPQSVKMIVVVPCLSFINKDRGTREHGSRSENSQIDLVRKIVSLWFESRKSHHVLSRLYVAQFQHRHGYIGMVDEE
jgi:hypothetical protein